jgi:hypothetical protein
MDEKITQLLDQVEDALWREDQRAASILLHKVLLQDFTNHHAWQLLHTLRGGEEPFKEFQKTFSQKYYPQLAHLIATQEAVVEPPPPQPVPIEPTFTPQSPAFLPIPPEIPSTTPGRHCPSCGSTLNATAKYCSVCGISFIADSPGGRLHTVPRFPAPQASVLFTDGTVRVRRLKTFVGAAIKFKVLVDGSERDMIRNGEERTYKLPTGEHTFEVKIRKNNSKPVAVKLYPGDTLQLVCQPPRYSLKAVGPELEIVATAAPLPKARGVFAWLGTTGCIIILIFGCLGSIAGAVTTTLLFNK